MTTEAHASTRPETADPARADPHLLACMEIWGGSESIDNRISVPGVDLHVWCRPHNGDKDGGDIHYASTCAAGIISRFVLADVSGHGAAAGDTARVLRRLMRKHINTPDQSRFARALNDEFMQLDRAGVFATALIATYFAPTDHLILCNAGHPRPLWYHRAARAWKILRHDDPEVSEARAAPDVRISDLPLGIIEPTDYHQFAAWLAPGDLVVAYTDGLTEARSPAGEQLGEAGLLNMVAGFEDVPAETLGPALLERLRDYTGGRPIDDDITLLVLHHNAANPPRLPLRERIRVLGRVLGLA